MINKKVQLNIPNATLIPIIAEELSKGKLVKFAPKGKSMLPLLREGYDTVTLRGITEPLKKYDIGLYLRENGQYVLHRIVKVNNHITCVGDNQYLLETGLLPSQFIGVVCEFSRGGKNYSVTSWQYKLYCRILHLSRPFRYFLFRVIRKLKSIFKSG